MPGPLLDDVRRESAAVQIARELRVLAAREQGPITEPEMWLAIAGALGLRTYGYEAAPGTCRGRLTHSSAFDAWVIEYDDSSESAQQSKILVHEIAHWYERAAAPEWLTGDPVVYHYGGNLNDERHQIARRVEELIFG